MANKKRKSTHAVRSGRLVRLSSRIRTTKARAIVAGAIFALVAVPASWMMVSAQTADTDPKAGKQPESSAGTGASRNGQRNSAGDAGGQGIKSADGSAKKNETDTKQAANGQPGSGTPTDSAGSVAPSTSKPVASPPPPPMPTGWHENVIATVFWVGEAAGPDNADISNAQSAWDGNWESNYGGYDDPNNRNGYLPAGFTPKENPFYFALPYNDLDENGNRKATASNCPNVGGSISWCKNAWIAITKDGKTAYAQWQDVGPLGEDDVAYVFGTAAPANAWGAAAGLDVSPAVRDYLGMTGIDRVSWKFVSAAEVPAGPWRQIVTTNPGGW